MLCGFLQQHKKKILKIEELEKEMLWEGGRNLGKASRDKRPGAKALAVQTDGASPCQQPRDRPRHCLPEVLWLPPALPSAPPPSTGPQSTMCQLGARGCGIKSESWELCFQTDSVPASGGNSPEQKPHTWDLPSTHRPYNPIPPKCPKERPKWADREAESHGCAGTSDFGVIS